TLLAQDAIRRLIFRLQRNKSLGLVTQDYLSATYTRWEHHIGVLYLSRLPQVSSDERRILSVLALLGGSGHLPYGYPVEKAVLLAAWRSPKVRDEIASIIEPLRVMA